MGDRKTAEGKRCCTAGRQGCTQVWGRTEPKANPWPPERACGSACAHRGWPGCQGTSLKSPTSPQNESILRGNARHLPGECFNSLLSAIFLYFYTCISNISFICSCACSPPLGLFVCLSPPGPSLPLSVPGSTLYVPPFATSDSIFIALLCLLLTFLVLLSLPELAYSLPQLSLLFSFRNTELGDLFSSPL